MIRFILFICFLIVPTIAFPESQTECIAIDKAFSTFDCLSMPSSSKRIPCIDTNEQCPDWASSGECQKNPQYMLIHCRKSCGSCISLDSTQIAPDESTREQVLYKLIETQEYQHHQAERTVETLKTCINYEEMCTQWSLTGECDRNPAFMHRVCAPACKTCHS